MSRRETRGRAQPKSHPFLSAMVRAAASYLTPSAELPHLENGESVTQTTFAVRITEAAYQQLAQVRAASESRASETEPGLKPA